MIVSRTILGCAMCALVACSASPTDTPGEETGQVMLEIKQAPLDARCARISTVHESGTIHHDIPLVPGQTTVSKLDGLPLGDVTLSEAVYTVACANIATASPKWASDSVSVTLEPGVPVTVSFSLYLVGEGGSVTVHTEFPDTGVEITEFPTTQYPATITSGPDGALWFGVAHFAGQEPMFGRMTTSGSVQLFPAELSNSYTSLTTGPDGNLWAGSWGFVARFVTGDDGVTVTEFPLGGISSSVHGLTTGPDGALWFASFGDDVVGRVTTSGVLTTFPLEDGARPVGCAVGPDRKIWFTEAHTSRIGRLDPATGTMTEFPLPESHSNPHSIVAGPDGRLWFTLPGTNRIGRITVNGAVTEFLLPTPNAYPANITVGADGNVWFTEYIAGQIGRVTTTGEVTEFPTPTPNSAPNSIVAGPDGNIWFTEDQGNIGRIEL